ncbi:hypothetical protein WK59_08850 [Burkholderia ubonensis]|nr:hypothetical protein WK59_08850 [Burkholderia ubonensis]
MIHVSGRRLENVRNLRGCGASPAVACTDTRHSKAPASTANARIVFVTPQFRVVLMLTIFPT